MRLSGKRSLIALVFAAGLAASSHASLPPLPDDYGSLSVLTPAGPQEPSAEAFRRLARLIHARHKVLKGEDVRSIAASYGTDVRSLQSTNNNEFIFLSRGGYIRVHNGRGYLYEVLSDAETLQGVARRFKPKDAPLADFEDAVVRANGLPASAMLPKTPYRFKKGDRLLLPGIYLNLDTYRLPLPYFAGVSSGFGTRFHPVLHRSIFHKGMDLPMPIGTPVFPSRSGEVVYAGWRSGFGNVVEMRHHDGSMTRYGHLSKISVVVGEIAQKSKTMLGRVGSTGLSTGPHLHFEIITPSGRSINPRSKLGRL